MKVSIITVVYNAVATIRDAIDSVLSQTHKDIEHIIIDGGSTDGTTDIITEYRDKIEVFVSEPDNGIYDAMNKGLRCAKGEVVGFLNSDDMFRSNSVITTIANVFSDPKIEACYGDLVYVDQHDTGKIVRYWKSRPFKKGLYQWGWMPAHPTFYVRRRIYEKLGGFDLEFKLQSDFEITTRFLEVHGVNARYVPEIFVKMRTGGATNRSIRNIVRGNIEAYRACRKNGLNVTPLFVVRKILSRIPQFFQQPAKLSA